MENKIITWTTFFLATVGLIFLVYLVCITIKTVHNELRLNFIYENCKKIKPGMKIEDVYAILGKDVIPKSVIEMSYDSSIYRHFLQYPEQFIDEYYFSIELDSTEKIVINVLGCDP